MYHLALAPLSPLSQHCVHAIQFRACDVTNTRLDLPSEVTSALVDVNITLDAMLQIEAIQNYTCLSYGTYMYDPLPLFFICCLADRYPRLSRRTMFHASSLNPLGRMSRPRPSPFPMVPLPATATTQFRATIMEPNTYAIGIVMARRGFRFPRPLRSQS